MTDFPRLDSAGLRGARAEALRQLGRPDNDAMTDLVHRLRHPVWDAYPAHGSGTVPLASESVIKDMNMAAAKIESLETMLAASESLKAGYIDRSEVLGAALLRIHEWSKAYPVEAFPEPSQEDWAKLADLLKGAGMTLDKFSASNMRHVVEGVGKIAAEALG